MKKDDKIPLHQQSIQMQELLLIEDLMYAMMSIEGQFIKKRPDATDRSTFKYVLETECEKSIREMVGKMLPICSFHDKIETFVSINSQFQYGLVSQGLCEGIRLLLREYLT